MAVSCYQKLCSYYQITARLLHPEEDDKGEQQKQGEVRFLKNIFSLDFLTFWLSYRTYSIVTSSGTQQVNFMEKFDVKVGISCIYILY